MAKRSYNEECAYVDRLNDTSYRIREGFVPNMRVPGRFYVNDKLRPLMFDELRHHVNSAGVGGFLPAMKQVCTLTRAHTAHSLTHVLLYLSFSLSLSHTYTLTLGVQIANVACLPGIVGQSIGLPDVHAGVCVYV